MVQHDPHLETKRCSRCKVEKPYARFSPDKGRCPPYTSQCLDCRKTWRDGNKEQVSLWARKSALNRLYGLTQDDLDWMLASQDGRCAICERTLPYTTNGLCVDHNHKTGFVRALLCVPCNLILGNSGEDRKILLAAIHYLEVFDE